MQLPPSTSDNTFDDLLQDLSPAWQGERVWTTYYFTNT